jgi:hypothetical protein
MEHGAALRTLSGGRRPAPDPLDAAERRRVRAVVGAGAVFFGLEEHDGGGQVDSKVVEGEGGVADQQYALLRAGDESGSSITRIG